MELLTNTGIIGQPGNSISGCCSSAQPNSILEVKQMSVTMTGMYSCFLFHVRSTCAWFLGQVQISPKLLLLLFSLCLGVCCGYCHDLIHT